METIRELYQDVILDHGKHPRNFHKIDGTAGVEGDNPLCGDHVTLYVKLDGDRIADIAFEGQGCAISKASASMMTQTLKGRSKGDAERMFHDFHEMLTHDLGKGTPPESLGKLAVFAGVSEFPARVKCASLAWHTLHAALEGGAEKVSTE
ncbi:MAG: Fe-S cluster assembly sulfur transfer protein SufU [Thermoplasmatota archaeon]